MVLLEVLEQLLTVHVADKDQAQDLLHNLAKLLLGVHALHNFYEFLRVLVHQQPHPFLQARLLEQFLLARQFLALFLYVSDARELEGSFGLLLELLLEADLVLDDEVDLIPHFVSVFEQELLQSKVEVSVPVESEGQFSRLDEFVVVEVVTQSHLVFSPLSFLILYFLLELVSEVHPGLEERVCSSSHQLVASYVQCPQLFFVSLNCAHTSAFLQIPQLQTSIDCTRDHLGSLVYEIHPHKLVHVPLKRCQASSCCQVPCLY